MRTPTLDSKSAFVSRVVLVPLLGLAACGGIEPGEGLPEQVPPQPASCTRQPGQPGGPGGDGGRVEVRYRTLEGADVHELVAMLQADGGQAGAPGFPPPDQPAVTDGKPGVVEVEQDSELVVTLPPDVAPDDELLVSSGNIYLKTKTIDAGPLRVRRVEIAPGTTLRLSGGWVIEADEITVHPGASIVISDLGDRTENVFGNTVGSKGGALVLRARRLVLDGAIIAAGLPGEPTRPGQPGGIVKLEVEQLRLGSEAAIDVGGGDGGAGEDGRACE
jgi:hypothetical protein